jgi:hypothetical protein
MRLNASRFVLRASACHQFTGSGAVRRGPSVSGMQPDDLSAAGSCETALARRHRTGSLGRVEVTDRDDMPPGLHDPGAGVRRTEAVPALSAAGGGAKPPGSGTRSAAQSHAINPVTSVVIPAMMANVEEVEVVVAHNERATQTFTVPSGIAALTEAVVEIGPDSTVTVHASLSVNGTQHADTTSTAAGDTTFGFGTVPERRRQGNADAHYDCHLRQDHHRLQRRSHPRPVHHQQQWPDGAANLSTAPRRAPIGDLRPRRLKDRQLDGSFVLSGGGTAANLETLSW